MGRAIAGCVAVVAIFVLSCGPGAPSIQATVDAKILTAVAGIPTLVPPTPQPSPTPIVLPPPLPQPTPQPIPSPRSTATPQPTPSPQPTPTPQAVIDLSDVYSTAWPAVFYVETTGGNGTGWLLEPGLIVTAQHVVGQDRTVTIRHAGPAFSATVLGYDSLRDIALLSYKPGVVTLPSSLRPIRLADAVSGSHNASTVLLLGYADTEPDAEGIVGSPAAKVGVQSQIADFGGSSYGLNLQIDAAVDPGDSGGPVLNGEGQLVGMARGFVPSAPSGQRIIGVFYAVAVDEIRTTLPALKAGMSR